MHRKLVRKRGAWSNGPMTRDVHFQVVDGVLEVVITGQRPSHEPDAVADAKERWAEIARRARAPGVAGVLVIVRLVGVHSSLRAMTVAKAAGALGLPRGLPVAMVNEDLVSFVHTDFAARLAASRGWLARAFEDEAEARAWLREDPRLRIEAMDAAQRQASRPAPLRRVVHELIIDTRRHAIDAAEIVQTAVHVMRQAIGCTRVAAWRLDATADGWFLHLVAGADAARWMLPTEPAVRLPISDAQVEALRTSPCVVRDDASPEDACWTPWRTGAEGAAARATVSIVVPSARADAPAGVLTCLDESPRDWGEQLVSEIGHCAAELAPLLADRRG